MYEINISKIFNTFSMIFNYLSSLRLESVFCPGLYVQALSLYVLFASGFPKLELSDLLSLRFRVSLSWSLSWF